jgi:hypothetical protein
VYVIARWYDALQDLEALDLAHVVWVHWVLDHLAYEGKDAGRRLFQFLAAEDPTLRRCLRFGGRLSRALGDHLGAEPDAAERAALVGPVAIATSMPAEDARPVVAFWHGHASLAGTLPSPRSGAIASMVRVVTQACEAFSKGAVATHVELVADLAEALRTSAAIGHPLGHERWARDRVDAALEMLNLPDAVRSRLFADRAARRLRTMRTAALVDIEAVLALADGDRAARAQALFLRARSRLRTEPDAALTTLLPRS